MDLTDACQPVTDRGLATVPLSDNIIPSPIEMEQLTIITSEYLLTTDLLIATQILSPKTVEE